MPKFIIVDHTLRDLLGHHYEYSVSTAEAAGRRGYEPIILANKDYSVGPLEGDIRIIPQFRKGWFDAPPPPPLKMEPKGSLGLHLRFMLQILNRQSQRVQRVAQLTVDYLNRAREGYGRLRPRVREHRLLGVARRAAKLTLLLFAILFAPVFVLVLAAGFGYKVFRAFFQRSPAEEGFGVELMEGLQSLQVVPDDHVFIHTLRVEQLEELLRAIQPVERSTLPHFHILLRRDFEEPFIQNAEGLGLPRLLQIFSSSRLWPLKFSFYTDTEPLTDQHNRIGKVRFVTVPIPFRHELIQEAGENREGGKALNVVYLGDARKEKGYQFLPDAVDFLYDKYCSGGQLRFTIHSYIQPGNIQEMRLPYNRLLQYPSDHVALIPGQLSPRDYYAVLAEADIVVIPYIASDYGRRSSGIFTEALAAGIPVVVPSGTWMANEAGDTKGASFEEPSEIGAAIETIIGSYQQYRAATEAFVPTWRKRHSPEALVDCLLNTAREQVGNAPPDEAPSILFIMDGDPFYYDTGSSVVARHQLQYLADCGYRVYSVFLPWASESDVFSPYELLVKRVEEATMDLPLEKKWTLSYQPTFWRYRKGFKVFMRGRAYIHSLEQGMNIRSGYKISKSLKNFVKNTKIDAVFLNYITNWPIVERLSLQDHPVICETHDIQSYQAASYGERLAREEEVRAEAALLDRCDALLMISKLEREKLKPYIDPEKMFFVAPHISIPAFDMSDLAGYSNISEVLEQAGMLSEDLQFTDAVIQSRQAEKLREAKYMDLLFIGSLHLPNIHGFKWFFENVFMPHLAPRGVNLCLAGSICSHVQWALSHPLVYMTGRVRDLEPLYASSRVIIIPVLEGAGASIKTIEALGFRKPVVATGVAMRGIEYDREKFPVYDTPDAFSERVLELLQSPGARLLAARTGYQIYQSNNSLRVYRENMNPVFRRVLGDRALQPIMTAEAAEKTELCEWSPEILALRTMIHNYLYGITPDAVDRENAAKAIENNSQGCNWLKRFCAKYIHRLTNSTNGKEALASHGSVLHIEGKNFQRFVETGHRTGRNMLTAPQRLNLSRESSRQFTTSIAQDQWVVGNNARAFLSFPQAEKLQLILSVRSPDWIGDQIVNVSLNNKKLGTIKVNADPGRNLYQLPIPADLNRNPTNVLELSMKNAAIPPGGEDFRMISLYVDRLEVDFES